MEAVDPSVSLDLLIRSFGAPAARNAGTPLIRSDSPQDIRRGGIICQDWQI